jgi:phosphatidate cytidylyltransferase
MNPIAKARLFDCGAAFAHPITLGVTIGLILVLALAPVIIVALARAGFIGPNLRAELFRRYWSWLVIVPLLLVPILLGAFWTIAGIGILSVLCYREYSRATGLFREKLLSLVLAAGIVGLALATLDNWYRLFVALTPLTVAALAAVALLADRPQGYIQRVGLAVLGFFLFGTALAHLAWFANDGNYRPYLILIILGVEANDVFAFCCGKLFGRRKLAPHTSPNKTVAGALGAIFLTTMLVVVVGWFLFPAEVIAAHGVTRLQELRYLAVFGVMISTVGQLGDLMLSAIKRDIGIKDLGVLIPGHGGLLDRFDSLILVAPAAFHYANYIAGIGINQPIKVFTGGGL